MNAIVEFLRDEEGATAIEYGLIAGLVAIGIIGAITLLGGNLATMFRAIATRIGGTDATATQ